MFTINIKIEVLYKKATNRRERYMILLASNIAKIIQLHTRKRSRLLLTIYSVYIILCSTYISMYSLEHAINLNWHLVQHIHIQNTREQDTARDAYLRTYECTESREQRMKKCLNLFFSFFVLSPVF